MRSGKAIIFILALLGSFAPPSVASAASAAASTDGKAAAASGAPASAPAMYTLEFTRTQNALPGAQGSMTINVVDGQTIVHFRLRGGYPNTLYTI